MAPSCAMLELQFDESPLYDSLFETKSIRPADGLFIVDAAYEDAPALDIDVITAHPYRAVAPGVETLLNQ